MVTQTVILTRSDKHRGTTSTSNLSRTHGDKSPANRPGN
jgi:hypothetical protein